MNSLCVIRGARVIDPAKNRDEIADLWIGDGLILNSPPPLAPDTPVEEIQAHGLIAAPGLIDMHVHLREPGQTHKETIATGTRAAAAGGFTTLLAMPNTSPPVDSPSTVRWLQERIRDTAVVNVLIAGAITRNLEGEELAPIGSMRKAGVVALTDDGHCIQNHEVMRRAMEYTAQFHIPLLDHCQEYTLTDGAVMHEGTWSLRLGLPGWPREAEEIIVSRDITLARLTGAHLHCQHLSSAGSVSLVRNAKAEGLPVTAEVCPHHIWFTDESLRGFSSQFKMNPPLREQSDIEALLEGLADGTIGVLATDHAPHASYEKEVELDKAPFGITGLESALAACATLLIHQRKIWDWPQLLRAFTAAPAGILGIPAGTLSPGSPADITLIDPAKEWVFDNNRSLSLARNTPFHGIPFKGRVMRTLVSGRTVWNADSPT